MQGIEERTTQSGIHIFRVHYTGDPMKRSKEWIDEAARGMIGGVNGKAWKREMEIDWTIASGLPVYADEFVRDWHVAKEPLLAYTDRPVYRGHDFGLTPACCWCQVDPMGRLNVLSELSTWDGRGPMKQMGIERFAPIVILRSNEDYGGCNFKDVADPAGWQKAQTDEKSCVDLMREKGIHPVAGPVAWTIRKARMVEMLSKAVGGRPAIQIDPGCTMLIEGFQGAYRYEEIGETGRFKDAVEKNAWSHIMNALEYVVGYLYQNEKQKEHHLPKRGKVRDVTGY
jgi:hypothetical protein